MQGALVQLKASAPDYTADEMTTSLECPFPKCANASRISPGPGIIPSPASSLPATEVKAYVWEFVSATVCESLLLVLNLVCDLWNGWHPKETGTWW